MTVSAEVKGRSGHVTVEQLNRLSLAEMQFRTTCTVEVECILNGLLGGGLRSARVLLVLKMDSVMSVNTRTRTLDAAINRQDRRV